MIKLWVKSVRLTRWETFDLVETNAGVLGQMHIFEVKAVISGYGYPGNPLMSLLPGSMSVIGILYSHW